MSSSNLPIAVDAMGGDAAPGVVVAGAALAARELGVAVSLVGPRSRVIAELAGIDDANDLSLEVIDAPDAVSMAEPAHHVLRRNRPTSIRVAIDLVSRGKAAGIFSAGHTGATVMTAYTGLGMVEGVDRPALAATLPTLSGIAVLLDVGATVECKAAHLLQFGAMGCAFAAAALDVASPRVGLLSIGEEARKGNDLTRDAYKLLEASGLSFIGNLEAADLFTGRADVIVCDGFTGNVALKVSEGLVEAIDTLLEEEIAGSPAARVGAVLASGALRRFRSRVDYSEYGGAPLLGVLGLCVVGHGRSTAKAIRNGIALTRRYATGNLTARLARQVASVSAAFSAVDGPSPPGARSGPA